MYIKMKNSQVRFTEFPPLSIQEPGHSMWNWSFLTVMICLKPGMFVRVSMDLGEVETFVVPANTVLVQEGTNTRFVFVEKSNTC